MSEPDKLPEAVSKPRPMRFVSVDPGAKTGCVLWEHGRPLSVATVRVATTAERKRSLAGLLADSSPLIAVVHQPDFSGDTLCLPRHRWWHSCVKDSAAMVVEESFGPSAKTVAQMGERRGYLEAICEHHNRAFATVNTSEWRKVVGQALGVAFPRDSKLAKALAKKLVHELYAIAVTDDEADAVLIGLWAYLTRTWDDPSFSLPVRTPNV